MRMTFPACLLAGWTSVCAASPVTLNEETLLELAPRITLEEPEITSFLVEGAVDCGKGGFSFVVAGREPDHVTVRIFDQRDGTPLLIGADDTSMAYDPSFPRILKGTLVPQFRAHVKELEKEAEDGKKMREFMCGFAVKDAKDTEAENRELRRRSVLIDIPSMLKGSTNPFSISSENGEQFIAEAISEKGSKLRIWVSPAREEGACTRMEVFHDGSTSPFFQLSRIEINQPVPDEYFYFPQEALMNSGLPVTNLTVAGADKEMAYAVGLGFRIRAAIIEGENSHIRTCANCAQCLPKREIDWEVLREKDNVNSGILRNLFRCNTDFVLLNQ